MIHQPPKYDSDKDLYGKCTRDSGIDAFKVHSLLVG